MEKFFTVIFTIFVLSVGVVALFSESETLRDICMWITIFFGIVSIFGLAFPKHMN